MGVSSDLGSFTWNLDQQEVSEKMPCSIRAKQDGRQFFTVSGGPMIPPQVDGCKQCVRLHHTTSNPSCLGPENGKGCSPFLFSSLGLVRLGGRQV